MLVALLLFSQGLYMSELRSLEEHNQRIFERMEAEHSELRELLPAEQMARFETRQDFEIELRRTLMPGVIALMVTVVIVLTFWFMVNYYYLRPTLTIQQRLHNFLRHNVPFNGPPAARDEIARLRDNVATLISMIRKGK